MIHASKRPPLTLTDLFFAMCCCLSAEPAALPAALLKLVISHSMAGAFIGSKGIRLNQTVATSGASIRVASRQSLFSGEGQRE